MTDIFAWHRHFPNSIEWRLTSSGIMTRDADGMKLPTSKGEPLTMRTLWKNHGPAILKWSKTYLVPAELIAACIATEAGNDPYALRFEPGYKSDMSTPNKVSPGIMQTLLSTARETLKRRGMGDASTLVTREWLFIPENSIRAGTSYMEQQRKVTGFDPVLVAAAYNAGSVYLNDGQNNKFKLRCYPLGTDDHVERFVMWFNDFYGMLNRGEIPKPALTLFYKENKNVG